LDGLEHREKPQAVELEPRTDVRVHLGPREGPVESFLLPFEVVLLAVGGDPGVEKGRPLLLFAHETVDLGLRYPSLVPHSLNDPESPSPVHPLERRDSETEPPCGLPRAKGNIHADTMVSGPCYRLSR